MVGSGDIGLFFTSRWELHLSMCFKVLSDADLSWDAEDSIHLSECSIVFGVHIPNVTRYHKCPVGGLEHFFPYIGNNHPNWLIFFQRVWNHQPDVILWPWMGNLLQYLPRKASVPRTAGHGYGAWNKLCCARAPSAARLCCVLQYIIHTIHISLIYLSIITCILYIYIIYTYYIYIVMSRSHDCIYLYYKYYK